MELERRREGCVEILMLNRPDQRNALNPELIGQLSLAFADTLDVLFRREGDPYDGTNKAAGAIIGPLPLLALARYGQVLDGAS